MRCARTSTGSVHDRLGEFRGQGVSDKCGTCRKLEGETCGIPHLAKNERDVGHPAVVAGIEPQKRMMPDQWEATPYVRITLKRNASELGNVSSLRDCFVAASTEGFVCCRNERTIKRPFDI
jgi:hypothetical protein